MSSCPVPPFHVKEKETRPIIENERAEETEYSCHWKEKARENRRQNGKRHRKREKEGRLGHVVSDSGSCSSSSNNIQRRCKNPTTMVQGITAETGMEMEPSERRKRDAHSGVE